MMAYWIKEPDKKNTYRCSNCGSEITTGQPIEYWTRCPFCHADMEVNHADPDAEKNP